MNTLVVMSGLPCVGKSSVAQELARRLGLVLVELDHLEAPLLDHGIRGDDLGWAGYEMITALANDNLALGHSVLLDAVAWTNAIRASWAVLAAQHRAEFRPIEVICSDERVHRDRVQRRNRDLAGYPETAWDDIEIAVGRYETWDGDRLLLDTVRPLESLVAQAAEYVTGLSE